MNDPDALEHVTLSGELTLIGTALQSTSRFLGNYLSQSSYQPLNDMGGTCLQIARYTKLDVEENALASEATA